MSRSRVRILSALFTTAVLAVAVLSGLRAAWASPERAPTAVRFVLDYRGSVNGTWQNTSTVELGLKCIGHDLSGSFTSAVRPGSKRYTLLIYKDIDGRHLLLDWGSQRPKGVVSSNRTAKGWFMKYSGGECHQVTKDESDCAPHTFAGDVALLPDGGNFDFNHNRVYFDWQAEPRREPGTIFNCDDGIFYDQADGTNMGQHFAKMFVKNLYRCGMRKPRRCTAKIGRKSDYPFHKVEGRETFDSKVHVEWSVTFRAVGKR
jgi:hypothetical protein